MWSSCERRDYCVNTSVWSCCNRGDFVWMCQCGLALIAGIGVWRYQRQCHNAVTDYCPSWLSFQYLLLHCCSSAMWTLPCTCLNILHLLTGHRSLVTSLMPPNWSNKTTIYLLNVICSLYFLALGTWNKCMKKWRIEFNEHFAGKHLGD